MTTLMTDVDEAGKPAPEVVWISDLADVRKALRRWQGADSVAQAWAYLVSHSQLAVRIYRRHENGSPSPASLYLLLKDCHQVSFRDSWRDVDIRIEERPGKFGLEFMVTDGDRFSVHCGVHPFVAESSELLKLPFA